ncbi:MAG TPA: DUF3500 domain-containing protein [Ramlibacter sp.]|nr:DUF3500 domain-containing protein [Ramlibacter sp.]
MSTSFRQFLRAPDDPRLSGIEHRDAYSHAAHAWERPPLRALLEGWEHLYRQDFHGISCDGCCRPELFTLQEEGAPVMAAMSAARRLLQACTPEQRPLLRHPLGAREWRAWMNPEIYVRRHGLRLDEAGAVLREAVLALLRASLSPAGYERVRNLMRINHFLGELVRAPRVMNEYSYNLSLFGEPSAHEPWGFQFFGHHIGLNVLFRGGQMVATPAFFGAEPHAIDEGPFAGVREFADEERLALELMRALPAPLRQQAQLHADKRDPALPPGRVAFADDLMLAGAFQDNRVITPEGSCAARFEAVLRQRLGDLVAAYLAYLPAGPRAARLADFDRHLDQTHFCWIGGCDDEDPFYYRIQSPVLLIEFDHHAGVFLGNSTPQRFHVHTVVRTPNGNDYGMAVVKRHCEAMQAAALRETGG